METTQITSEQLETHLKQGVVVFEFNKASDGSGRVAVGTLQPSLLDKLFAPIEQYKKAVLLLREGVNTSIDAILIHRPTEFEAEVNDVLTFFSPKEEKSHEPDKKVLRYWDLQRNNWRTVRRDAEINLISKDDKQ